MTSRWCTSTASRAITRSTWPPPTSTPEIAATSAHALQVTKTADGLIFEVPWAQFGPFELMWIDADAPTPGGDDTDDPDQGGQQAVDETDRPHGDLVQTGDSSLAIIALLVCIAVVVIVAGIVLSRRSGRSSGRTRLRVADCTGCDDHALPGWAAADETWHFTQEVR